jgi:hypothetical protein
LKRLSRIPDVVGNQYTLARDPSGVEASQGEPVVRERERRKAAGRMGQRAAPVEEARERMGEERAASRRAGHDVGPREELRRQHVEQVLREPPDRRRMEEQLVRIEVDAPVEAVAVVEVAVAHQHFELLQLPERLAAQIVLTSHGVGPFLQRRGSHDPATALR